MRSKFLLAVFAAIIIFIPQKAYAQNIQQSSISSSEINIPEINNTGTDLRVKILSDYLKSQNSPLAPYAKDFIASADRYNLDWKLVAAISGVESTFGEATPTDSYNAWGWGVYGDNVIRFKSWKDGINTVSQGLREKYMDKWGGKNIYEIGSVYASSKAWPYHVEYYLTKIQQFALDNPQDTLSLSL